VSVSCLRLIHAHVDWLSISHVESLLHPTQEVDVSMNFDELILDAAKSIAAATAALIKAASEAQKELVAQGKIQKTATVGSEDGQWSEGLVSAARLVAAATHNLCEAANALVKGHSSEEKLIGAAKQVAGSTAQLLLACKVKADPDSASMGRLEAASNAVRRATDNLVKAAQQALDKEEEAAGVDLNTSAVSSVIEVSIQRPIHFSYDNTKNAFCRKSTRAARSCGWSASWRSLDGSSSDFIKVHIRRTRKQIILGKLAKDSALHEVGLGAIELLP